MPWNEPQNIHPLRFGILSSTHVGSNASHGRRVTRCFLWCAPVTQVSSVHSIFDHCFMLQLRCSWAQAKRIRRFFSEIGGLHKAIYRLNPALSSVCCITYSVIPQARTRASCAYVRRRWALEAHTKVINSCVRVSSSVGGLPHRFLGVGWSEWQVCSTWSYVIRSCCDMAS